MVEPTQAQARVILIEGLPGSGKTSLAEWLCARIESLGISATWIPELRRDHPVIDRSTMRTARDHGYVDRCIARWEEYSRGLQTRGSPRVSILEGCLFQSTVRFLVEHDRSEAEIDSYLPAVERCLAPLRAHLIYLVQTEPRAYLHDEIDHRKGADTVSRIATYSAGTPFSVSRGLRGRSALVSLYTSYRRVCDRLVERSVWPTMEVDATRCSEAAVRGLVGPWVAAAVAS